MRKTLTLSVVFLLLFLTVSLPYITRPVFATTDLIDSYSESNSDNDGTLTAVFPSSGASVSARGQSFNQTLTTNHKITLTRFYLKKTLNPIGHLAAVLYTHSGTYGVSSVPTGSALATSDSIDMSGLSTSYALVNFTFTGAQQYTLIANTTYCIQIVVIDATQIDSNNRVSIGRDFSSPNHGGNMAYWANSVWTYLATFDICFYVYGVLASTTTTFNFSETAKVLDTTLAVKSKTFSHSEVGLISVVPFFVKSKGFMFSEVVYCLVSQLFLKDKSFLFVETLNGSVTSPSGQALFLFPILARMTAYFELVTENTFLDPIVFMFKDGALIGFLVILCIICIIQFLSEWSFVITTPLCILIALMYFKRFIDYPPPASNEYLMWFGIFFSLLAPTMLLIRRKK